MSFNNFLNKSIYILLAVLLCIAIFIGSFFFNPFSFADDSLVSVLPVYSGSIDNTALISNGVLVGSYITNRYYLSNNSSDPTYIFYSLADNKVVVFSASNCSIYYNTSSSNYTSVSLSDRSTTYNGYKYSFAPLSNLPISSWDSLLLNQFSDIQTGIDSILSSVSSVSYDRTITIKPGYVAYVETDGGTLDLTATFPILSNFSRPLWNDHVRIAFGGYYAPSSGTIFNDSFGSSIDWLKPASAPTNILGKTYIGGRSFDAGLPSDGSSVVIYNPAYMGFNNVDPSNHNGQTGPTLTAHFSNVVFVQQFPLRTSSTFDSSAGWVLDAGSPDNYDDSFIYSPSDSDASTIVSDTDYYYYDRSDDTTSSAISLPNGGYNTDVDNTATVEDGNRTIRGLLNTIIEFLSAPIAHIQNLFNSGSSFMTWLSQLFTWLPEPVSAVITSALIVLIVIGVIKFLWK